MVETAAANCASAETVFIMRLRDGDLLPAPAAADVQRGVGSNYLSENPIVAEPRARLLDASRLKGRTVHILDASCRSGIHVSESTGWLGYRTMLSVPLLRDSVAIGVIVLDEAKFDHSATSRSSWSRPSPTRQ